MDEYRKYEPIFGAWYLSRLLGKGSFGKVFEITREEYGTTYKAALKIISVPQDDDDVKSRMTEGTDVDTISEYYEGILKEIINENELMAKLKGNSNIVSYEDHQIIPHEDSIGYDILIRMELLTPLLDRILEQKLEEKDVVKLGIDMCKALEVCHKKNIIHRDIKPQNIFISDNGDYKLGDLGIARTMEKTTGGMSKKGTYKYMAPEVFKGEDYDSTADIYSLGIVLYTLLNGNRGPFLPAPPAKVTHNDEEEARMRRFRGEPVPAPNGAGPMLGYIIQKACAYEPKDRYRTAAQMRRDLESYRNNYGESTDHLAGMPDDEKTELDSNIRAYTGSVPADRMRQSQYITPPLQSQYQQPQYAQARPAPEKNNTLKYAAIIGAALLAVVIGIVIIVGGRGKTEPETPPIESKLPATAVEWNGHYYNIYNEPMSWTAAESACEALDGHLVTITSADEQAFIRSALEDDGLQKKHYWIGGTDRDNVGEWKWVTGEPFTYTNWDPGNGDDHDPQPNNLAGQDYIELQTISNTGNNYMTWNDMFDSGDNGSNPGDPWYYAQAYFGYICEWETNPDAAAE